LYRFGVQPGTASPASSDDSVRAELELWVRNQQSLMAKVSQNGANFDCIRSKTRSRGNRK
jgi:hypothetical protein